MPIDSRTRLVEGLLGPLTVRREWKTLRATIIALDQPGLAVALYVTCIVDELGHTSVHR